MEVVHTECVQSATKAAVEERQPVLDAYINPLSPKNDGQRPNPYELKSSNVSKTARRLQPIPAQQGQGRDVL